MAVKRKKKEEVAVDENMSFADAMEDVVEDLTEGMPEKVFCSSGNSLLDRILGGGFLTGNYHVLCAPSQSGKSSIAICTVTKFLEQYEKGIVFWIDAEQSTVDERFMQLGVPYAHKLDENGNEIIDPETGMPMPQMRKTKNRKTGEIKSSVEWDNRFMKVSVNVTLETAFKLIDKAVEKKVAIGREDEPMIVVLDSLTSMVTEEELEAENSNKVIGQKARGVDFCLKRHLFKLAQYNICMLIIAHIGNKLSMNPYEAYDGKMSSLQNLTLPGGKSLQYFPFNIVMFRSYVAKKYTEKIAEYGVSNGFIMTATTLKARGYASNITVPLVYGMFTGFEEYPTRYYNMIEDDWIVGKSTTYKTLPEFPDKKFTTKSFFEKVAKDPEFREMVDISWRNYITERYKKYGIAMRAQEMAGQSLPEDEDLESDEIEEEMEKLMSMGEPGEIESHSPGTANFKKKPSSVYEEE